VGCRMALLFYRKAPHETIAYNILWVHIIYFFTQKIV
jgi:hypothetical protein